jgi:multimeric flavodoxin WrbA
MNFSDIEMKLGMNTMIVYNNELQIKFCVGCFAWTGNHPVDS